jgi:hypothetical protein
MTAMAALPWIEQELRQDVPRWRASRSWDTALGPYGLAPFRLQPAPEWIGPDLIGIDLGSFAVALANHRNKTVTGLWMRNPVAQRAVRKLGYAAGK